MNILGIKIYYESINKQCSNLGWRFRHTPIFRKLWGGDLIYIGLNTRYFIVDKRRINNVNDFVDAMTSPMIWKILRKFTYSKNSNNSKQ